MSKIKTFFIAIMIIAIYSNLSISKEADSSIVFSLSQLEALAQSPVEVKDGVTGKPRDGGWNSGFAMEDSQYQSGSSETYDGSGSAGTGGVDVGGGVSTTETYKTISCCTTSNSNTACNAQAQSPEC